jgi:hypothetical protein
MGRQLTKKQPSDAAAAATRPSGRPPLSSSSARRGRLLGRTDTNAELVLYAEAWARKIQLNTAIDTVGELAKRPHAHPLVTVALRRDGSVESVTFVVSSGVAEIDEAIRRIVQTQAPYQAFSPALAGERRHRVAPDGTSIRQSGCTDAQRPAALPHRGRHVLAMPTMQAKASAW